MRESALKLIVCPSCGGPLTVTQGAVGRADQIDHGVLECVGCAARHDILDGIPRLASARVNEGSQATARRFGKQWKTFVEMTDYQEAKLVEWLHPIGPEAFKGKRVYEAGCGKGRHSVVAAGWGAKDLLALDLSEAVDVAYGNTRNLPNVHVVQADLLNPPLKAVFDLAFSVGVLHHLPSPREGLDAVVSVLKPGGTVAAWVYGYESNEWVVRWLDPVRKGVTSKMPHWALYWLTLPPAVGVSAFSKLYGIPPLARKLPMSGYMRWLSALPLREVHNIAFDQLTPPIAHYLPREEVRSWFARDHFQEVVITPFRDNSWRASARVRAAEPAPGA
jgi:SAM-dependent methyltransferase